VFKSLDGGVTWTEANTGLPSIASVSAMAIDPVSPTTLYVGTFLPVFDPPSPSAPGTGSPPRDTLFKSIDGGQSWAPADGGLPPTMVMALAIDPLSPATIYAATQSTGVFKSVDGGQSWTAANTGLMSEGLAALAIDPATPATLYAGTYGGGVFKSVDGGGSWTPINAGLTSMTISALAIDPVTPAIVYAGTGLDGIGGGGKVFRSIDGGAHWNAFDSGLTSNAISALAIDSTGKGLHAATANGVFDYQLSSTPPPPPPPPNRSRQPRVTQFRSLQ
ncbi:MAG TPA: hypothetical protein VKJ00_05505, partial [Thermoanaerobaculia bacterium]|nr:hypothetical protein [Thermoanaerobaculia bacterium]